MTRSDSTILVTRLDQVMTRLWLDKISDDSDSKGSWLWLDRNDSGTSLDWKQAFAKLINFSSLYHLGGHKKDLGSTAPECPPWLRACSGSHMGEKRIQSNI